VVKTIYEQRTLGVQPARLNQSNAPEQMMQQVENSALKTAGELYKTADDIYKMDFDIASRRMISDIYSKNPNDPEKLRKEFDEAQKGLLKDASPMQAMELQAKFEYMTMQHLASATQNKLKINNDQLKEKSLEHLNYLQNSLEHNALGMLSDDPVVQAASSKSAQADFLSMQETLNAKDSNGNPIFSADQRVSATVNMRQKMMLYAANEQLKNADDPELAYQQIINDEKKLEFKDPDNNVQASLSIKDDLSVDDLWRLQRTKDQLIKEKKAVVAETQKIETGRSIADGDITGDPRNAADREAFNAWFETQVQGLQNLPQNERNQEIINIVSRSGIVPDQVKSSISAQLNNGNPQQRLLASEQMLSIINNNPKVSEQFNSSDIEYALAIKNNYFAGADIEQVIKDVNDKINPTKKEELEARAKQFKEIGKDFDAIAFARKAFADQSTAKMFGNNVTLPEDARLEFGYKTDIENKFLEFYTRYPNPDVAQKQLELYVQNNYGVTHIDGHPRITELPIEKEYKINGVNDYGWIANQLFDAVEKIDTTIPHENLLINADAQTKSEKRSGQSPTYPIQYFDDTGAVVNLTDKNNMPVRFRPNLDEGLKAEKAKIANADAYHQARIDNEEDPSRAFTNPLYDPKAKVQQSVGSVTKAQVKARLSKTERIRQEGEKARLRGKII